MEAPRRRLRLLRVALLPVRGARCSRSRHWVVPAMCPNCGTRAQPVSKLVPKSSMALDLAKTEKAKDLLRVAVIGPNDINRLFTLPPGVPAERVAAMRTAFDATFNDPEFKAEVEKARVVLRPISVERIKEVALLWLDMPESDKKELQQILKIK